jgi:hypothetical protein
MENCSSSDGFTKGGDATVAPMLGKDRNVRDGVLDIFHKGVQVDAFAIIDPYVPGGVRGSGAFCTMGIAAGLPNKQ